MSDKFFRMGLFKQESNKKMHSTCNVEKMPKNLNTNVKIQKYFTLTSITFTTFISAVNDSGARFKLTVVISSPTS